MAEESQALELDRKKSGGRAQAPDKGAFFDAIFSVAKRQREKIAKTLEKSGLALDYRHGVMVIFYLKSLFW
ncbi:hypothetical protein [Geobacillus thermoleovorans]|uniref:hypothetical protein n=1 Tax=Geobacillus thermoleovorans TaxID=33941 RepID=UPI003D2533B1